MSESLPRRKADSTEIAVAFDIERRGDTLYIKLAGEADLFGSSKLRQAIVKNMDGVSRIIFDLGELNFADSYFLRLLIRLRKRLGGVSSVKVKNVRPNIKRIFEVTGLDKVFM